MSVNLILGDGATGQGTAVVNGASAQAIQGQVGEFHAISITVGSEGVGSLNIQQNGIVKVSDDLGREPTGK